MDSPNCHGCKFKRNIPGNAHVSCAHPKFEKVHDDPISDLLVIAGGGIDTGIEKTLGLKAEAHGILSGWCSFPFNYDPIWLRGTCKGFEKKEE